MKQKMIFGLLLVAAIAVTPLSAWSNGLPTPQPCLLKGVVNMNFDAVALTDGGNATAAPYFNSFGVTFTPITPDITPSIYNLTGLPISVAASSPNVLIVSRSGAGPVSYTLDLCAPVRFVSFKRAAVGLAFSTPAWTMKALDANGVEVGSVGEGDLTGDGMSQSFTLYGDNIRKLRFDANNTTAYLNHPPLDDFILDAGVTDNQSRSHVFAQFVDGVFPDGSSYRSTAMISSDNPTSTACSATLGGLTIPGFGDGTTRTFNIAAGSWVTMTTPGTQPLATGYATVICNAPVTAQVLYSAYSPTSQLLGQATVFSSPNAGIAQLLADQSIGGQLGIAIANTGAASTQYTIVALDSTDTLAGQGTVMIPAHGQISKFLSELVTVPNDFVGRVLIGTNPFNIGNVYAIGLRFSGQVFTTIPVTSRTPIP